MRIPVVINKVQPGAADALLIEGRTAAPTGTYAVQFDVPAYRIGHVPGCACCAPRGPVSDALATLFRARATGAAPFFTRVVVWTASQAGAAAVVAALSEDVLSAARFRLAVD